LLTAFDNQKNYFKNHKITPPHSQVYTDNTSLQILVKKNDDFIKNNKPTVQYNNSLTTTNFNLEPTMTSTPMTTSVPISCTPTCPYGYTNTNGLCLKGENPNNSNYNITVSYNDFVGPAKKNRPTDIIYDNYECKTSGGLVANTKSTICTRKSNGVPIC
jgi:hypothetical protein